jgi:signal transduction histidine kinase
LPLIRVATIVTVLVAGAGAEAAAPGSFDALKLADLAVGVGIGCGGAALLGRARRPGLLGVAVSLAWFLGTLDGASKSALSAVGAAFLLAYRGPLLHLLLAVPSGRLPGRRAHGLAAASWGAALLPLSIAGPATAAAGALVALSVLIRGRRAAADRRPALIATGCAALALAAVWTSATVGVGGDIALLVLNDLVVLVAGAIALTAAAGLWAGDASRAVVVELGPTRRPGRPIRARLSRVLADPELEVRYAVAGVGWVDEAGRSAPDPGDDGRPVTRASAPEGGEVALVHGVEGVADPRLVRAAASAAALALDAARLEAEVLVRAADVRASRNRILEVADAERRSLEQRLNDGVLARLRRVDRLLASVEGDATSVERSELRAATADLLALSRGLYPPALARADLGRALVEIADRSPVSTTVEVEGNLAELPESHRAAIWFVCSEALANAARHAHASHAAVSLRVGGKHVAVEVRDDGCGGATLTRGLLGLADRIDALGGGFDLNSPAGGPTVVFVRLPV